MKNRIFIIEIQVNNNINIAKKCVKNKLKNVYLLSSLFHITKNLLR